MLETQQRDLPEAKRDLSSTTQPNYHSILTPVHLSMLCLTSVCLW